MFYAWKFSSLTGLYIGIGYVSLKLLCYYDTFTTLLNWITQLYTFIGAFISFFTQKWVTIVCFFLSFCDLFLFADIFADFHVCDRLWWMDISAGVGSDQQKICACALAACLVGKKKFFCSQKNFFARLVLLAQLSELFGVLRVFVFGLCCSFLLLISSGFVDAGGGETDDDEEEEEKKEEVEEQNPLDGTNHQNKVIQSNNFFSV